MIANEQQYRVSRRKERSFHEAIERLDTQGSEANAVHPRIRQAEREGMESQLGDLRAELAEYERLKAAGFGERCTVPRSRTKCEDDADKADD